MNHRQESSRIAQQRISTGGQHGKESQQQSSLPNDRQAIHFGTKRRHQDNDNRGEEFQQQSSLPNDRQAIRICTKRRHQEHDNQLHPVLIRTPQTHIPQSMRISNSAAQLNDHILCPISFI
jgi:hypothetical protein